MGLIFSGSAAVLFIAILVYRKFQNLKRLVFSEHFLTVYKLGQILSVLKVD